MRIENIWPAYGVGKKIATFDIVMPDGIRHRDWLLKRNEAGQHSVFSPNRQAVPMELRGTQKSKDVTALAVAAFYGDRADG